MSWGVTTSAGTVCELTLGFCYFFKCFALSFRSIGADIERSSTGVNNRDSLTALLKTASPKAFKVQVVQRTRIASLINPLSMHRLRLASPSVMNVS